MATNENIGALYRTRFSGDLALAKKSQIWQVLCRDFFQRWIPKNSSVVDVAAGYCEFLNHIQADQKIGYDLNPECTRFASTEVKIYNSSCIQLAELKDSSIDVFFASNFLEHLNAKEEAIQLFQNMFKKLKAGGRVLVLQPNITLVGTAYWDFLDHKLPWTESSLFELGESTGFRIAYGLKRFLPYTTKSALPQSASLVSLYLKLMPFSGWVFGKQSFVVFEKSP